MNDEPTIAEHAGKRPLSERMKINPDGLLEKIAQNYGVSTLDVARELPEEHCAIFTGDVLEAVLADVVSWGTVLFIVHTKTIVVEIKAVLPRATRMRGHFSFHGDGPFGGHLSEDSCTHLAFIDRPFMGRRSLSIQFFGHAGGAIFKIFVARDGDGELKSGQVEKFLRLRNQLAQFG